MKYWYFPTSFENTFGIISSNIIAKKENYKNYYTDIRDNYSSLIALFEDKNLQGISQALNMAKSEDATLKTCILEFASKDLSPFRKNTKANKGILELNYELGLSALSSIIFDSNDDLKEFKKQCALRKNVIINQTLKIAKPDLSNVFSSDLAFSKEENLWGNYENNKQAEEVIKEADALGGVLLALFYFSFSPFGSFLFKLFFRQESKNTEFDNSFGEYEKMIYEYFFTKNILNEKRSKIVKLCINSQNHENCKENILEFLQNINNTKLLEFLVNIQRNKLSFDEIQKHIQFSSLPEKILSLLFLKESLEDFIEYAQSYLAPNEAVVISLFFGLRDGYKRAFNQAKHNKMLQNKISNIMCAFVWQKKGVGILEFKNQKEPLSLFELAQDYMK